MATHRTLDEVWDNIVATLELGSGLKFALVEAASTQDRTNLRRRLQRYLKTQGKSLRMPLPQQDVLDWLSSEQTSPGIGEPPEETRWVVLPRTGEERFVLHRLNEGRDNLRRHMGGVLFVVGSRGMLQRLGNEAPDLWSVRELAVELGGSIKKAGRRGKTQPFYDVKLSFLRQDRLFAQDLRNRLENDGMRVDAWDTSLHGAPWRQLSFAWARPRYHVTLLSPSFFRSMGLDALLREIRLLGGMTNHIPILIRHAVLHPALRDLAYLDFRTDKQFEANYPRLLRILQSEPV